MDATSWSRERVTIAGERVGGVGDSKVRFGLEEAGEACRCSRKANPPECTGAPAEITLESQSASAKLESATLRQVHIAKWARSTNHRWPQDENCSFTTRTQQPSNNGVSSIFRAIVIKMDVTTTFFASSTRWHGLMVYSINNIYSSGANSRLRPAKGKTCA